MFYNSDNHNVMIYIKKKFDIYLTFIRTTPDAHRTVDGLAKSFEVCDVNTPIYFVKFLSGNVSKMYNNIKATVCAEVFSYFVYLYMVWLAAYLPKTLEDVSQVMTQDDSCRKQKRHYVQCSPDVLLRSVLVIGNTLGTRRLKNGR